MDDLIDFFKLDTETHPLYTQHTVYEPVLEQPDRRVVERWVPKKKLGQGGCGVVYLEEEQFQGKARAVKRIDKASGLDYKKELSAIAKFSKVRDFLFGFNPYEDEMSQQTIHPQTLSSNSVSAICPILWLV